MSRFMCACGARKAAKADRCVFCVFKTHRHEWVFSHVDEKVGVYWHACACGAKGFSQTYGAKPTKAHL